MVEKNIKLKISMMKAVSIKLKISIDNFCMSKDSSIELYKGGFRNAEIGQPFYPYFGPYHQLDEIADRLLAGTANDQMKEMFEAKEINISVKNESDFLAWANYMKWRRKKSSTGKWVNQDHKSWGSVTDEQLFDRYNSENDHAFTLNKIAC